jgi:hypothetical protein
MLQRWPCRAWCSTRAPCACLHRPEAARRPGSQAAGLLSWPAAAAAAAGRPVQEAVERRRQGPQRGIIINAGGKKLLSSAVILLKVRPLAPLGVLALLAPPGNSSRQAAGWQLPC